MDTRAGSYTRGLTTSAGEMSVRVPKLLSLPFETQIIERYRRRESSVEEALIEMYLAGVSVRRVEDITEMLWGERQDPTDDDLVVALRLHRYNRGLPCGAAVLRKHLLEEVGHFRSVPSVLRTIGQILKRQGLTHSRTGWYEGDDLNEEEHRLMIVAERHRNFAYDATPRGL